MAQLVLGVAGAAVGSLFGAPQLGWMIGSAFGSAFAPKQKYEAPQIEDLRFTRVDLGQAITWVAGSPVVTGNVIYTSIKRPIAHTEEAGGKNSGGAESSYWTYEIDVYIKLTENQIAGVSRAWKNGELVHGNGVTRSGIWAEMRVYTGGEGQLPDPDFEAAVGAEKAQAHLGCGAVFIKSLQLDSGGNMPVLKFEVNQPLVGDQYFDNVVLLMHLNNEIQDFSPTNKTTTASVAMQYEDVGDYGGGLNITNSSFVTVSDPNGDFVFDVNDDFEIEFSYRVSAYSPLNYMIHTPVAGAGPVYLFYVYQNYTVMGFAGAFTINFYHDYDTLYKVAFCRKAGVGIKIFINGALFYSGSDLASAVVGSSNFAVGNRNVAGGQYDGMVDELRITKGVVRHWAEYTPESSEFPNQYAPVSSGSGSDGLVSYVDAVVAQRMLRAGYTAAQFDVTALASITKPVRGLAIGRLTNTRSVLELLAQTHWFTWQKRGFQIVFLPRVEDVAASIPFDDLGVSTSATSDRTPLEFQFASELELPAQVSVTYPNVLNDYQPDTQLSDHFLSQQQSVENIELAVGMTPTEAKAVADAIQIERLAAMGKTTVTVPLKWLKIEPNDVVNLYDQAGREYRVRVGDVKDHGLYLEWDVVLDDVRATLSAGITDGGNTGQSTVQQMALTEWLPLDMPLIRDADNNPGWWVAAAPGVGDLWPGAAVLGSWDGVSFSKLADTTDAAVFGETTTALGDWTGGNVFDTTNSVTVSINGEASSYTRAAMLADLSLGVWLIGSEVIRARTATLVSAGVYRLSNLIRGFRGTEWAMGTHVVGERAVLINSALRRVATQQSHIGLERQIKAITAGLAQTTATAEAFTDTGIALKPFAPVNLKGAWDVGTGDLALTWRRRTRLSHRFLAPGIEPPLGEASELYDVEIWDTGFTTLKHTFSSVTTPSQTYTAAQQTTDFGAPQSSVGVRVYQRSEAVSRGYKLQGVV